ncbi:hypothetical protein KBD20_03165 [Candidatus Saccharibacteria bacterium]|nr:hypothetical protein [Candidatus Saccharibacteria bacterium]
MIKAVICGTYRRDSSGLKQLFKELETNGVRILSPLSIDFISTLPAVVKTRTDESLPISILELLHLRAIREADFVWLHAPDGYVGISGSFEVGYATAKRIPIFCKERIQDEMLQTQVTVCASVFEAFTHLGFVN